MELTASMGFAARTLRSRQEESPRICALTLSDIVRMVEAKIRIIQASAQIMNNGRTAPCSGRNKEFIYKRLSYDCSRI